MKLGEVTVNNYRSITSQTKFEVKDLTTLIGPNNEGKSNLLRALRLGMSLIESWSALPPEISGKQELTGPDFSYVTNLGRMRARDHGLEGDDYRWARDYPIQKQGKKGTHPTVVRLTFNLTESEVADFLNQTGISNNGNLPIEIKLTNRSATFGVVKPGKGAASHRAKATEIAKFIVDRLSFVSVPAIRTVDQAQRMVNDLARIKIRELSTSEKYNKLLAELDNMRQESVAELNETLGGSVRRYLPSVRSIELISTRFEMTDSVRDVFIDDGSHTSIQMKGDGVKSLVTLALIQELANLRSESHGFVLTIDEPEAHLHAKAVHELQSLFQGMSSKQQVIVATHNPVFVNRDNVESNILVLSNQAKPAKQIAQIREAIGVMLHDNLDSAETVVLVEGLTDAEILQSIFKKMNPQYRSDLLSGRVVIKPTKGTGKLRALISREKSSICRILAVLDGDSAGRGEVADIVSNSILPPANIFTIRDSSKTESEIEDIIIPDVYLDKISSELERTFTPNHFRNPNKKWSSLLESAANSLGVSIEGSALTTKAKIIVAQAVSNSGSEVVKGSAQENINALAKLIWP